MSSILLSRDAFREGVFARDNHTCVFCDKPAKDAHHIMERRLFPDGGYYLANGASVCEEHHLACEQTTLSLEQVRDAAGITSPVIPPHLYSDQEYDKWGNPVMANGTRLKGELFFDESVQKILGKGGVLGLFSDWVKYPRTHHLPWSPGLTDDDRVLSSMAPFVGQRVIVSEKMDGENTTMYPDYFHARSVDGRSHPSRSWAKRFWSEICGHIPPGWRVCCENLYAQHSIVYNDLGSFVLGFSIWNEKNECLSWDDTVLWAELLGLPLVKVLYDGIYEEAVIRALWTEKDWGKTEGYVVRLADQIAYGEFRTKVGKFVRKGHVQTSKHWMRGQVIKPNKMLATK